MYKVLHVDDHKIIRDGIKMYFEEKSEYEFAEAQNGIEALEIIQEQTFDLIMTDLSMPIMDGIGLIENIRARDESQKIMLFTMVSEIHYIKKAMGLGVNGYLLKNCNKEEILNAVDQVLSGKNYYAEDVTKAVMEGLSGKLIQPKQRLTLITPLSAREKEVLKLITDEKSNIQIANQLFISIRTVDAHKRNLLQKTGTKNIAGLVMYAIENNLLNENKIQ